MPRKDIHSDVEGHGTMRVKRSDDAEPETTESTDASAEPEVQGQLMKGRGGPVAEVKGPGAEG